MTKKKIQYSITLVCDVCLKELIIPNKELEPWAPDTYELAKGWIIPPLAREIVRNNGPWAVPNKLQIEVPASDVKCYCPEHAKNKENGIVAESG